MPDRRGDEPRLENLFHQAAEIRGDARGDFVDQHCGTDEALKRELTSLLSHGDDDTRDYLDSASVASLAPDRPDDRPQPEVIGQYKVLSRIGAGGMGIVYEALQEKPHRRVAIKVLRPGLSGP